MPSSITFCNRFTWDVSGKNCRSKKIRKAVLKFTTHAFIARFENGKRMVVLTPFLQARGALYHADLLDAAVIHGDGTTTSAKKGGDNIGFNGHKKVKGDKIVAFCDRHCNVIAPFVSAPGNQNESPLLRDALPEVTRIAGSIGLDLRGTIVSLDGVYDCPRNRKAIFNRSMVPNINPNPRNRQSTKRGRKPFFDAAIFKERFNTIERVFGWEDKFRHLLLRFERLSELHYAFKSLAYTMINLRHFC